MASRLRLNNKCQFCGEEVEVVRDVILKQTPHYNNVEFVATRTGIKQYIHSSCWYQMIKDKHPYYGKMYV